MNLKETQLFGKDDTPGVVAIEAKDLYADQSCVEVFRRDGDKVISEERDLHPFFYLSETEALADVAPERFTLHRLQDYTLSHYDYLVVFSNWGDYKDVAKRVQNYYDGSSTDADDIMHRVWDPVAQFQIQSGVTSFMDMQFSDLRRMQVDIETTTESSFPDADRLEDEIIIVSMSDSTGWECVIHQQCGYVGEHNSVVCKDEAELLRTLADLIQQRDPDVLEGHNFYSFDMDYIAARSELRNIKMAWGRDGSEPYRSESSVRFAEKMFDYPHFQVHGRHVIDTMFLVMAYDVIKRDMSSYGLKAAAKYFGLADEDRTYVEGSRIPEVWKEDPARLIDYALDDVRETRAISKQLSGSTFYSARVIPMQYGRLAVSGSNAKIENIFVREYLRQSYALPSATDGKQESGGFTEIFYRGVFDRLIYADVSSLYPAIMLQYECTPGEKDPLGVFISTLQGLTDLRLESKAAMNEAEDETLREELDARQGSYKILINSYYGILSFALALWNNHSEGNRVASTGRDILKHMIACIERDGGQVIEVDTDGVIFTPGPDMDIERSDEAEAAYVRSLTERMPEGIEIDHDGSFKSMLSYRKKNYALLDYNGKLKIKGSSLISRAQESFIRDFVSEVVPQFLKRDLESVRDIFLRYRDMILSSKWDVSDFQQTQTLKDTFRTYENKVELGHGNGGRHRAAAYEVAKRDHEATGEEYGVGSRVSYYIQAGPRLTRIRTSSHAVHSRHWDADNPDEHTSYYYKRRFLGSAVEKFALLLDEHDFNRVFAEQQSLFASDSDLSDVTIKQQRLRDPITEHEDHIFDQSDAKDLLPVAVQPTQPLSYAV